VQIRRVLAVAALALLTACAIYGFIHERLFDQPVWLPVGWARFVGYAALFWVAAGITIALRPKWLPAAAALAVLGYSTWWCGVEFQLVAPVAVLYFLASSFLLGKILARRADGPTALLVGLAVWILAISVAVHFPVNTRITYAAAFAVPFVFEGRRLKEHARGLRLAVNSRAEAAGLAVLLFVLLAHWLVALKPEVSSDGLSMHLAVPMTVAYQAQWPFDFRLYVWALMPMGGDWAYTGAYLLGGEAAARLLNFAMLVAIAAMIRRASLRWLSPAAASLAAALFISTPMVQLVTGSLFVENVWAAMVLAAVLELWRYLESGEAGGLVLAGLLFGSALSTKLGAAVFVALPAAIGILVAAQRKHMRQAAWAGLLFLAFAAPPYVNAWRKTGNPIFPFANGVFRSPYFETASSVDDPRFHAPLNWRTLYDLAFHSQRYYESQNGALGFQYFLLLLPAALVMTRKSALLPMAVGGASVLLLLVILPNMRYMYPALALFSIPIGWMTTQFRGGQFAVVALTGLNLWFMPASGWFHKDFALFRRSQADKYLESSAPQRRLIEDLNRSSPGEPVAFFGGDPIAGLHAPAYSDTWHSAQYLKLLRDCSSPEAVALVFQELGIHHVIAPLTREADFPVVQYFLQRWTAPTGVTSGHFGLFDIVPMPVPKSHDNVPAPPGEYDDLDPRIDYTGTWFHDYQFPQTSRGSVTYSNVPGNTIQFSFTGTSITYIYTRAFNRGIARVAIDGHGRAFINLYSREIQWQARSVFSGLDEGTHTIEIGVTQQKSQDSSGRYVDLDGFIVK
jgi:hypothetical protein